MDNKTFGRALYEAFGRGDAGTVLGRLAADVDWREAETQPYADGNPYIAPQRVGEGVFGRIMSDVDGFATFQQYTDTAQMSRILG